MNESNQKSKGPNAVALGRRGGKKGGRIRADNLGPKRRSEIASKAARARWGGARVGSSSRARDKGQKSEEVRMLILAAAHREFTAVGLAGARVDRIAARAGVNKRMLYYHFGNKEALFQEMLRRNVLELEEAESKSPRHLAEELAYWRDLLISNRDWIRLSLWEALTYGSRDIVAEKERSEFWQSGVLQLQKAQGSGKIAPEIDAGILQVYLFALVAFPLVLPQMTKLITGMETTDPEFLKLQNELFRSLSSWLEIKASSVSRE